MLAAPAQRQDRAASEYSLSAHVRVCRVEDNVVLLDLRADKYIALSSKHAAALTGIVQGWPEFSQSPSGPGVSTETVALLKEMQERRLIDRSCCQPIPPVSTLAATASVLDHLDRTPAEADWRTLLRLLRAAASVRWRLRTQSLEQHLNAIADRKARVGHDALRTDAERTRLAVARYHRLRPIFHTSRDECLRDSLVLLEYLFLSRLLADLIIGVRMRPFRAHCWVQQKEVALNCDYERANAFTPILVI